MSNRLYVLVYDGCEWEDIQIFTTEESARDHLARAGKGARIEIFEKNGASYVPTYICIE